MQRRPRQQPHRAGAANNGQADQQGPKPGEAGTTGTCLMSTTLAAAYLIVAAHAPPWSVASSVSIDSNGADVTGGHARKDLCAAGRPR